jgi:predicted small secreted protein
MQIGFFAYWRKYAMKKRFTVLMMIIAVAALLLSNDIWLNDIKLSGYKALKVFVQFKDEHVVTSDFLEYQTEHFIIKYRPEDEEIIRETAIMFEDSYTAIAKEYDYSPVDSTVVVIYKDQNEFWDYQKSIQGQAVMGLYNMGTIHVISPNVYEGQKANYMEYYRQNGPVLHEYVHKVVDELTGGNIELWLTEGLALYEEYSINGAEWAPYYEYERYLSSQEIGEGFMYADEVQVYRQSFDMTKYLMDVYGRERMQSLLQELKNGSSLNKAFLSIYGMEADEFIDSQVYVN